MDGRLWWPPKSPSVGIPWDSVHAQGPEKGTTDENSVQSKERVGGVFLHFTVVPCGDGEEITGRTLFRPWERMEKGYNTQLVVG
jgi:hypothetical protein